MRIRMLSKNQKAVANAAIKSMGLRVFSGSYNADNLKFDIMIDKGCAATYKGELSILKNRELFFYFFHTNLRYGRFGK